MSGGGKLRHVVLVGSSGGGAATLGHTDPEGLRAALDTQLRSAGATVTAAVFVACLEPLDSAAGSAPAALWTRAGGGSGLSCELRGTLDEVNVAARKLDQGLAFAIHDFDGVVAVSADAGAGGVNRGVLAAAGRCGVPVAGTGGTSLSIAAGELGCRLAGNAGGSVATTPQSKAIGVAAALAGAWGVAYSPSMPDSGALYSALDGCLPAFLAVSCARAAVARLPVGGGLAGFASSADAALRERALPPTVGAIVAQQTSGLGEIAVLGGALVGALSRGSPCCALLAGRALSWCAPRLLALNARLAVPATASTLSVSGGLAAGVGLATHAVAPHVEAATDALRSVLGALLSSGSPTPTCWPAAMPLPPRWLNGGIAGLLMNFGSRRGWYHQIFLPLILIEMEHGGMSLLGALDWLTLCMTGAGACAAQLLVPRRREAEGDGTSALARRGLCINLAFGDYIEACFPFLEGDRLLDAAVYAASAGAGAIVACGEAAASTAYLAAPLAVGLGTSPRRLIAAALVAFGMPLAAGVVSNLLAAAA